MKKETAFKSLGTYDKNDNLVSYVEFKGEEELKCFFSVSENSLTSKFVNDYNDGGKLETVSSTVDYSDNVMLFSLCLDGETAIKAIPSGETFTSFNTPPITSRVDTYQGSTDNETTIQNFTIKSDLIDEWLNKL